jgi:hypothetical protein
MFEIYSCTSNTKRELDQQYIIVHFYILHATIFLFADIFFLCE